MHFSAALQQLLGMLGHAITIAMFAAATAALHSQSPIRRALWLRAQGTGCHCWSSGFLERSCGTGMVWAAGLAV